MITILKAVARQAGGIILDFYNVEDRGSIKVKGDGSPLTRADQAAHDLIVDALEKNFPNIPVISEEGSTAPWSERHLWKEFFLVDPLDGTKEFLNRNGEFTVNIALIRGLRPVLGVIYVPVTGVMYSAGQHHGAWREDPGSAPVRLHVSAASIDGPITIVGSRSHATPEMDGFLGAFESSTLLTRGSSLKLCLVAEGEADLYPRHGRTSLWDIAAGDCIVTEAGGVVVDANGAMLEYGSSDSFYNNPFLVANHLDSQLIQRFARSIIS